MADTYKYANESWMYKTSEKASLSIPDNLQGSKMLPDSLMNSVGLYSKEDIEKAKYQNFSRFGRILDPYGKLNDCREYLFFVKPDLHICVPAGKVTSGSGADPIYKISGASAVTADSSIMYSNNGLRLNPQLGGNSYFRDLIDTHPNVIKQLQYSANVGASPFCNLLSFGVNNYLEVGSSESSTLDNPSTIFGTNYEYLKDSEESDENPSFSLEFVDDKDLNIYHFFKAYSEYHIARKSGLITPPDISYYQYKRLHNTMGIYKFVVAEDMETIVYWAYIWGVYPISTPREAFADPLFTDGLTFSVSFKGAFIEDMNPILLHQFNQLMYPVLSSNNLNKDKWLPVVYQNYHDDSGGIVKGPHSYDPNILGTNATSATFAGARYELGISDRVNGTLPKAALVDGRIYNNFDKAKPKYRLRWYG